MFRILTQQNKEQREQRSERRKKILGHIPFCSHCEVGIALGPQRLSLCPVTKAHNTRAMVVYTIALGRWERAIRETQVLKGDTASVLPKRESKFPIRRDAGGKSWWWQYRLTKLQPTFPCPCITGYLSAEFSGSETRKYNWISRFGKVCEKRKHFKCPEEKLECTSAGNVKSPKVCYLNNGVRITKGEFAISKLIEGDLGGRSSDSMRKT